MAEQIVSDAVAFPQDDGTGVPDGNERWDSGGYFGALSFHVDGAYVKDGGLQFDNVDTTNDTVDVTAGRAFLELSGATVQSAVGGDNAPSYDTTLAETIIIAVELPTDVTGLSLSTDAVNDVYLYYDSSAGDVVLRFGSAVSTPSDPYVKLGTVDSSSGNTSRGQVGYVINARRIKEKDNRVATRLWTTNWTTNSNIDHADLANIGSSDHHSRPSAGSGLTESAGAFDLTNDSVSVAGNTVSLGGSTGVAHGDLTNIGSSDHHTPPSAGTGISASSNTFNADERVNYDPGMVDWVDGLSSDEVWRTELSAGEKCVIERIEFRQKGGGSSTSASVDVYDASSSTVVGSADLGSTTNNPGDSGSGSSVVARVSNSTGGSITANPRVIGYVTSTYPDMIDDFETQSLSAYSGDTGSYDFETSNPIRGAASLRRPDSSTSGYDRIWSTSGLNSYPEKGQHFHVRMVGDVSSASGTTLQGSLLFGVVDDDNWYSVRYEFNDNDLFLTKMDNTTQTTLIAATTVIPGGYTAGDEIVLEVTWDDGSLGGSDNDIVARLYNDDKSTLYDSVSANDSTYATDVGVGFRSTTNVSTSGMLFDNCELIESVGNNGS